MNTTALLASVILCGCLGAVVRAADTEPRQAPETKKTLNHVVCIKFKDSATPEQIKAVEEAFRALKGQVPGINSLEWGTNVSLENRNKGFTHCFILSFGNEKDRDSYLTHPAHKDFGKVLGPVMADVFVIDFWVQE